jgi:hypothetical protein
MMYFTYHCKFTYGKALGITLASPSAQAFGEQASILSLPAYRPALAFGFAQSSTGHRLVKLFTKECAEVADSALRQTQH